MNRAEQFRFGADMILKKLIFSVFCAAIMSVATSAWADLTPLNGAAVAPNIAEISISEDGVSVELEIFVNDVRQFEDLLPDSWVPPESKARMPEIDRLKRFSNQGLSIRTGSGEVLPVTVKNVAPRIRVDRAPPNAGKVDPITGRMIPEPPEDSRVVYAELFYDFQGQKPNRLEIVPPANDEGVSKVSIGMIVFDREVPVTDFRSLSAVARLTIDWDDPWYSKFDNPNLRRHHQYPAMAFLYANPYEIRHEVLLRVRDAAMFAEVELNGELLAATDREAIDKTLPNLLRTNSPMTIDGKLANPKLDRISYHKISPSGLLFLEKGEAVRTDAALVGLIFSVPTEEFAMEATVEWSLFTDAIQKIPVQAIDSAGPFISELTPDEPILVWTNYFKDYEPSTIAPVGYGDERSFNVPAVSIVLALLTIIATALLYRKKSISYSVRFTLIGALVLATAVSSQTGWLKVVNPFAGIPDNPAVTRITGQLIENIHNTFHEKTLERIDAALASSISTVEFEDIKRELERSLLVEMQGGGVGAITGMRELSVSNIRSTSGGGGFQASVGWTATASGEHWGHPHIKNVRFRAIMDIDPIEDAWKLTGITVTSVQPET